MIQFRHFLLFRHPNQAQSGKLPEALTNKAVRTDPEQPQRARGETSVLFHTLTNNAVGKFNWLGILPFELDSYLIGR